MSDHILIIPTENMLAMPPSSSSTAIQFLYKNKTKDSFHFNKFHAKQATYTDMAVPLDIFSQPPLFLCIFFLISVAYAHFIRACVLLLLKWMKKIHYCKFCFTWSLVVGECHRVTFLHTQTLFQLLKATKWNCGSL